MRRFFFTHNSGWHPLWTQPGYEYSKVTIANGIAYTGVNQSSPYQFAAYNVQTGKRLWIVTLPCPVNNSAAVANNDVYFTCNYPNSTLYALRTSDGSTLWSQPSAGGIPAVANGIVYIGLEPATNTDNTFAAYNANTGALIWGARLGPFAIGDPAAIVNGVVYIASENDSTSNKSTMYAMNAKTGHVIWKIGFTGHIHNNTYTGLVTTPIANGVLYMETENDVVSPSQWIVTAYNVKTRAKLWQTSSSVSATSSPVVANARLYLWYGQALCSFHVPGL